MELVMLICWVLMGIIGLKMAEKRGREKWLGFVAGMLFGVFAFIYYAVAGETEEKKQERIKEAILKSVK